MLSAIFKTVLLMSATGGALALILLLIKPFTEKRFNPNWQYYIWLSVLLVMLIPFQISLPSEQTAVPAAADTAVYQSAAEPAANSENTAETTNVNQALTATTAANPASSAAINTESNQASKAAAILYNIDLMRLAAIIWLLGFAAVFGGKICRYAVFKRNIRKNSRTAGGFAASQNQPAVRQTDMLDAPLIIGLFKPTLYLPCADITAEDLNYIMSHELTHCKRHDLIYKWFAMLVASVHWFNPVSPIIIKQIDEACEISCDYLVTKAMTAPERKNYMRTILKLLAISHQTGRPLTTQMSGSKKIIHKRFHTIQRKPQTGKAVTFVSVFMAVLLFSGCAFAAGVAQDAAQDNYSIKISQNGETIDFVHKPFVADNTLYVPLREMLNAAGVGNKNIFYDQGTTQFIIYQNSANAAEIPYHLNRVTINSAYGYIGGDRSGSTENTEFIAKTLLKNGATYVPYDVIQRLSLSEQNIFQNISLEITDKNGNEPNLYGTKYKSENANFSLNLPLSWCGKYIVKEQNNQVIFLQKACYEKYGDGYGMLFYIETVAGKATNEQIEGDAGNRSVILQTEQYTYILGKPTEVQFPLITDEKTGDTNLAEADRAMGAEYDKMAAAIDSRIAPTISANVNFTPAENTAAENTGEQQIKNTINDFAAAFANADYQTMEKYCTAQCVETFFHPDNVNGIERAEIINLEINPLEYAKSSNDFNVLVTLRFVASENSSLYNGSKEPQTTSFYIQLLRQADGNYLINAFATGL